MRVEIEIRDRVGKRLFSEEVDTREPMVVAGAVQRAMAAFAQSFEESSFYATKYHRVRAESRIWESLAWPDRAALHLDNPAKTQQLILTQVHKQPEGEQS